jgi:ligand-binding sensor protein
MLQTSIVAEAGTMLTKPELINAPIRDTLNRQGSSTNQTGRDYMTRVNEGLIGFAILIVIGGVGVWSMKMISKNKQKQDNDDRVEEQS